MSLVGLPAFLLGESVFTTCLVANGSIQFLDEHLFRLQDNIDDFFFDLHRSSDELVQSLKKSLVKESFKDGALRITVFKNQQNKLEYSLTQRPLEKSSPFLRLKTEIGLRNEQLDYLKVGSYGKELYLKRLAKQKGFDDILFKDHKYLYEASTSNIFFLKDDKLITPEKNIYQGLMRKRIIHYNSVDVRTVTVDELSDFDGAFLTNSLYPIRPVTKIDNYEFTRKDYTFIKCM